MDDERLIQDFYDGDVGALNQLAAKYNEALIRFGTNILGDRPLAEEAVDQVWCKIVLSQWSPREGPRFDPAKGPFWQWLWAMTGHYAWIRLK